MLSQKETVHSLWFSALATKIWILEIRSICVSVLDTPGFQKMFYGVLRSCHLGAVYIHYGHRIGSGTLPDDEIHSGIKIFPRDPSRSTCAWKWHAQVIDVRDFCIVASIAGMLLLCCELRAGAYFAFPIAEQGRPGGCTRLLPGWLKVELS